MNKDKEKKCKRCNGKGKIQDGYIDMISMTPYFMKCPKCKGTGESTS